MSRTSGAPGFAGPARMRASPKTALVSVEALKVHYPTGPRSVFSRGQSTLRAVDGVSFHIERGETLGLVGESGCGKSTTGRSVLQLERPTEGRVRFDNVELTGMGQRRLRSFRKRMQIVFQDPYSSLNPRMKIGDFVAEPLKIHHLHGDRAQRRERVSELLEIVGLSPAHAARYPHEFSGGQRQRIAIARALSSEPEFLVCDEPIASLDVSIQSQVINLLERLQESLGLTYLFIAHDLSVVRHVSDRVAVMYLGQVIESADRDSLYQRPLHPYTAALLSAVPVPDPKIERRRERIVLQGSIPNAIDPPSGCRFHTRCPIAKDICALEEPPFEEVLPGQSVACHFWDEMANGILPGFSPSSV